MSERLSSSSGTSVINEDLTVAMRVNTSLPQGVDSRGTDQDVYYPFRPTISWFESDSPANVRINSDGWVPLKEDVSTGKYIITIPKGVAIIKKFEIDAAVAWQCTFSY